MKLLEIDPSAVVEIRSAAEWYEAREPGLGAQLIAAIDEAAVRATRLGPDCRPAPMLPVELGVQRVRCRRFPYVLFVIDRGSAVRILAVAHERRRPGYWMRRLRPSKR